MKTSLIDTFTSKAGSALLAVMGIVFLIAAVAAGMVAIGRQQVFSSIRLRDQVKAQMIAEAGVNDAYNVMKTNFSARLEPSSLPRKFVCGTSDTGTYNVAVASVVSNVSASIISTGFFGTATAMVRADVKNYASTTSSNGAPVPGGGSPYGWAVLAGCEIRWEGNSQLNLGSNGFMHANGSYQANGVNMLTGNVEACISIQLDGQAAIRGVAKSPLITAPTGNITSNRVGSVPVVSIPNIDLTPYYNVALANGQVFSGTKNLTGAITPAGGVMWVNGDIIFDKGTYNGSFIATGSMELKAPANNDTITITNSTHYPVLASRDGSIVVKQAKMFTFGGLIYVKTGNFDKQGNGDVAGRGAIIAAGNVTKNGGWSGFIYSDPTPATPGGTGSTGGGSSTDKAVITAWQE